MGNIKFDACTIDSNKVRSIIIKMLKKSTVSDLVDFEDSDLILHCSELWADNTVYVLNYKILVYNKNAYVLPNLASIYYSERDGKYHLDLTTIVIYPTWNNNNPDKEYIITDIMKLHDKFDLLDLVVGGKNNEK